MLKLLSIIFAFTPNMKPNMPNGKKFKFANTDELKKTMKSVENSKGNVGDFINYEKITKLVDTIVSTNNKLKGGDLFITVASLLKDGLINHGKSEGALTHSNNTSITDERTIQFTYVKIGRPYSKKIKSFLQGPVYDRFTKILSETRKDYLQPALKSELYSRAGANQKNFTFIDKDFFVTVGDIMELTDFHSNHKVAIENEYIKFFNKALKAMEDNTLSLQLKKRLDKKSSDVNMVRHYAALLGQETILKIYNRLPVYKVNLKLHMVRFNRMESSNEVDSIFGLIEELIWKNGSATLEEYTKTKDRVAYKKLLEGMEKIPEKKIKKKISSSTCDFSRQLHTTLDVQIIESEIFKRHCTVVKSWERTIPTGGTWHITVEELFGDGIYLNKLYELDNKKINRDRPLNHFFIIESFGDPSADIFRIKDEETFPRMHSPVLLSYDLKLSINHLSKAADQDEVMSYQKITKSTEFIDESLGLEFYPSREEYLNIDFDEINIGKPNPKHKYRLEYNRSILENQQTSQMDRFMDKLLKVDPEAAKKASKDDLDFISSDISDDNQELNLDDILDDIKKGEKYLRGESSEDKNEED